MNLGDLNKVWEVKALKRKPEEEKAKKMLDQIAKQVQPIMRKRKWRVKVLSEFCPKNPALLGVNVARGVHVKLRLRRANRDWDFIPYDQVLDTMLHELCHNVHGPHNANFYKLWDELRKECEELLSKGITGTGEGFDMQGKRLGGFSRQPPLSSLHKTALVAAEKRAKLGSMLPSGPKKLGGDSTIMGALSPIQAAAMAAERRFRDEIWCASQSVDISEDGESSTDIAEDFIDMAQSTGYSIQNKGQKRSYEQNSKTTFLPFHGRPESKTVDLSTDVSTSRSTFDDETKRIKRNCNSEKNSSSGSSFVDLTGEPSLLSMPHHDTGELAMWECGACTLLNPPLAPICDMCCTEKPKDASSKYKMWACKFCTLDNSVKLDKCSACNQWRYSNGPPVSTPAPNLGT
ncbi:DNA-dependent metalloprotease WSS1 [Euphorbia lathyris]|uniref:DNA-dependent metalloprotease WSS1 n=1 Tax=Euphorbia lathyris TaxID=212925 RepID=UPI0033144758